MALCFLAPFAIPSLPSPSPVVIARRPRVSACASSSVSDNGGDAQSTAPDAAKPTRRGEGAGRKLSAEEVVAAVRKLSPDSALSGPLGSIPSHTLVRFDEDGLAPVDRFVYVEERDCIGCTHCATTARATFCMETDHGRARVYRQAGDSPRMIEEAVDTCPVNCIYFTTFEDLVTLEKEREGQAINNWTRLVGGQDISSSRNVSKAEMNTSGIMRCTDCPRTIRMPLGPQASVLRSIQC